MARVSGLKGMYDLFPDEAAVWRFAEDALVRVAARFGYGEIRTPILEMTELFCRSVGEGTDIVRKEMYTFEDRGGRSVTLRPEGTAPIVRALISNAKVMPGQVERYFYLGPMFRYERPQAGRCRQFHQFGVELFGSNEPSADAEVIWLLREILLAVGIARHELRVSTVGCKACRAGFRDRIRADVASLTGLCADCTTRLDTNPLRILDCKIETCASRTLVLASPAERVCEACRAHFECVLADLDAIGVPYRVDPRLVRGLDYYTRTAFEFTSEGLGSQDSVGGGGRYDDLFVELGGPPEPGVGFGIGLERLVLSMKAQNAAAARPGPDFFACPVGDDAARRALLPLVAALRRAGHEVVADAVSKKVGKSLSRASDRRARFALILGPDELRESRVSVKDLGSKEQESISYHDLSAAVSRLSELAGRTRP